MASQTAQQATLTDIYLKQAVRVLALIGVLLVIAFCFFASSICIAVVLAAFVAILADPAVQFLERLRIPRYLAAALIVLAGAAVLSALVYGSYLKVSAFSDNFEVYADRLRELIAPINDRVQHVRDSASELVHETTAKGRPEMRVRETTSWATYLARGVGSIGGALIIAGVVPFLVFFMLNVREKLYTAFKALAGDRVEVDALLEKVKALVLGYTVGNIVIGAALSAVSILVFWKVGLTPAVTLGVVSGLLNLIPFVGMALAVAVPVVAGLVQFHSTVPFLVVIGVVSALHLVAANLLLPRFVGSRLDVGPVAATIGLLFWGWLWGIPGILLAVPLTAVLKLLADADPALAHLSNVLARNPRRSLRRKTVKAESAEPAMNKVG
ncbi:MAG TPA: AI-2E family transporter [Candidatus Acidoferrum sp.]|nr:AI-2E family transporter [Candidatus Acidoferrum sp.]